MLKQGVVQETVADLNGGALPPLHNLPHWSRVNNFDKARYPKPFLKDRLQPLPNPSEMEAVATINFQPIGGSQDSEEDSQLDMTRGMNPNQRIMHLEKSIHFLQQQHYEVLSSLHEEIDKLKRDNKDLQFHIVMMQKPLTPSSARSNRSIVRIDKQASNHRPDVINRSQIGGGAAYHRVPHPPSVPKHGASAEDVQDSPHSEQHSQASDEKSEELKIIFLEEEIKDLKKALKDERSRSHYLQQLVDTTERTPADMDIQSANPHHDHKAHSAGVRGSYQPHPPAAQHGPDDVEPTAPVTAYATPPPDVVSQTLPYNVTVNPLRVKIPNQPQRAPSTKECEAIIKHQQRVTDAQAHELNQLKSDLRDVLYSHKWTPDAFLLAKAYVAEDDAREMAEQSRLPRIELRHSTRKLPDIAYVNKDAVSLPALKHTMGNKAIERKRRAQILQKTRLGNKEVAN